MSVMLWLAAGLFLALRRLTKKIEDTQHGQKIWFVAPALLALGWFSMALAPLPWGLGSIGQLASSLVGWLMGLICGLLDIPVQSTAAILLVLIIIAGVIDLAKDKHPDKWCKFAIYSLPVLSLVAGGSIAAHIVDMVHQVGTATPDVVSQITK